MTPLSEVRESDAPPAVRRIYDDIKRATGIPQVNLIFRHLAVEPAVLEWAWGVIGPLYREGRVGAAVERLFSAPAATTRPLWDVPAIDREHDRAAIRAVLAYYDRGNSFNLIGLTALVRAAEGRQPQRPHSADASAGSSPARPVPLDPTPADIPPLPRREDVLPETLALVADLAQRQNADALGVIPSLYLHLTLWPEAVREVHATIRPQLDAPDWPRRVGDLVAKARDLADACSQYLGQTAPPPPEAAPYLRTVGQFVEGVIPQMALVGRILSGRQA